MGRRLRRQQSPGIQVSQVMLPLLIVSGAKPGPQLSDIPISQVMPEATKFKFLFIGGRHFMIRGQLEGVRSLLSLCLSQGSSSSHQRANVFVS